MKSRRALPLFTFATDRAIQAATPDQVDRVRLSVDEDGPDGCWLWTGYRDPNGYGITSLGNTKVRVHRATYWWFISPIDHKVEIDHRCRVRHCCNPDHLEAVSHAENVARGSAGAHWASQETCKRGHAFAGENLAIARNGQRRCKACNRDRMRQRRATARPVG